MNFKRLCLFPLLLLSGCALHSLDANGLRAADGLSRQYPVDAQILADEAAEELSRRYAPAHSGITLLSVPGAFAESFEQGLRTRGFAIMPAPAGMTVAAVTDVLQGETVPRGYVNVQISDGNRFSLMRRLGSMGSMPVPSAGQAQTSAPDEDNPLVGSVAVASLERPSLAAVLPSIQEKNVLTPEKKAAPVAMTPPMMLLAADSMVLPKAVLSVLPYNWRYTIPDVEKRRKRVNKPGTTPWREAMQRMGNEAGCTASFDEEARRVTFRTNPTVPFVEPAAPAAPVEVRVQAELVSPKATISVTPVSAPVPAVSVAASSSTPKPETLPTEDMSAAPAPTPSASTALSSDTPSSPASPAESWELQPGSLKSQLTEWASRAGYQLVWNAGSDLDMETQAQFHGTFVEALKKAFDGLQSSGHAWRVRLYQANKVMEVREE